MRKFNKKILNVSVIGMGIGEKHVQIYLENRYCNLVSICDFDIQKLKKLKNKYPEVQIYDNSQHIFNDPNIDLVSIASYDNYHSEQVIAAIKNNKHVMIEKPLCLNENEFKRIHRTHIANKRINMSSNFVLRSNDRFKKIKKKIHSNDFGDILFIDCDYLWGRKEKLFGWRADMDFYSIILGAAIHMIDLVMWMMQSKPKTVYAAGNKIGMEGSNINNNCFAILILKFNNGVIAKITGNGSCVHPHFHGMKIFGSKQTAIHDLDDAYFLNKSQSGFKRKMIIEPYPQKETRKEIINSFVDSIVNSQLNALVTQQDVYNVMSVGLAAEKSIKTQKEIKIDYLQL